MEELKKDGRFYWTLFSSTFMVSAFTVGGGAVIIPLLQKKFVDELHWIDQDEMMDMVAISQSAPGVMAVNASIIIGYRLAGIPGALLTVLGTVLPPLIILSVISYFYTAFASNKYVAMALRGMKAGVVAVMINVTWKLAKNIVKQKSALMNILMVAAAIAAIGLNINIIYIILACGVIGGVATVYNSRRAKKEGGGQ